MFDTSDDARSSAGSSRLAPREPRSPGADFLIEFWERLMRHLDGVCAWAQLRLTNAALAGKNSRVRGISQRARGYRAPDNLMLVLYHASWE